MEALGDAIEQKATQRRDLEKKVRELIKKHKKHLTDFDRNKDNKLQSDELDEAVSTIIEWGKRLTDASSEWFFHREGEVQGPTSLSDLEQELEENPGTFISKTGEEIWIPFNVLKEAKHLIEQPTESG